MQPSVDRLREVLRYEPETGKLFWLTNRASHVKAGDEAGCVGKKGYVQIYIDGNQLMAHRVIFAMVKGFWPALTVDHKDCNPSNNRWENLRAATQSKNCANSRLSKRNKLGFKGVSRHGKNSYRAKIKVRGREICLGTFQTPEAAHAAYMAKAVSMFGDFARSS